MSCLKTILLLLGFLLAPGMHAVNGYKITLKSNLKNHKVYMWYCYGDTKYPLDTSMTNQEGTAIFEKPYQLTGGVFILYLTPRKAFEFLLTEENNFLINTDTSDLTGLTTFSGSRENTIYFDFLKKISENDYRADNIARRIREGKLAADSQAILKTMYNVYVKQGDMIRKQVVQKNKGTFIADLIAAGMKPEVSRNQKVWAWQREMKRRFFENVNFADEKLAFSPVLFNVYEEYIDDYTYKSGDSLIAACDTILKKAEAAKENFKWTLYFLSSSFERSAVPGQDQVFVHLVENYYMKGKCWWLSKEQINNMARRAEILKHLFVGAVCPDFTAQDSSGKEKTLHSVINKVSVLYFWSYDCKHCLEETPKLVQWIKKHPEVHLVTACVTPDEDKWKEKLKEYKIPGDHFIDPDLKANYNYYYSIMSTPQIFVVGKNKKIIGKYIDDTAALDAFMQKLKHQK